MSTTTLRTRIGNLLNRLRPASVLRQRPVKEINVPRVLVNHNVFKNRTEGAGGSINLRLLFGRQIDDLGITTPFKIKYGVTIQTMLIITNQVSVWIS